MGFGVLNTREGVSLSNLRWLGREPVGAGYASRKVVRVLGCCEARFVEGLGLKSPPYPPRLFGAVKDIGFGYPTLGTVASIRPFLAALVAAYTPEARSAVLAASPGSDGDWFWPASPLGMGTAPAVTSDTAEDPRLNIFAPALVTATPLRTRIFTDAT